MQKKQDEEVIQLLQSDQQSEVDLGLSYLYAQLFPSVQRLITNNSGEPTDVPDVFQEGIVAFYKLVRQNKLANYNNVEGYLYSICRNIWIKELQKRKNTSQLIDNMQAIPVESQEVFILKSLDKESKMEKILKELSQDCHYILTLFYYEKKRMKEIMSLMDFANEQVAKNKKAKCMKRLRELIQSKNIGPTFFQD